jgi:DNA primase
MTREEILQHYSMLDIVRKYGLQPTKRGFISCPFHSEKTASLRVYRKDFYCFACGATGDIFSFVSRIENVDFKDAFLILGGDYGKPSKEAELLRIRMKEVEEKRRFEVEKRKEAERLVYEKIDNNRVMINLMSAWMKRLKPLSDEWCDCMKMREHCQFENEQIINYLDGGGDCEAIRGL